MGRTPSDRPTRQALWRFFFSAAPDLGALALGTLLETGVSLKPSINQRPAGPGGALVCQTADISNGSPLGGTSSIGRTARRPASRSFCTVCKGIPPQPSPLRRKLCFAKRSASRHVAGDITPNSRPADSSERSVRTICVYLASNSFGTLPLCFTNG